MFAYLAVSALCVIFDRIYALFGHGVFSASMSLMFLYPLLGGLVPFFLIWLFMVRIDRIRHFRFFYNSYNSGLSALTVASLLKGIFEIAGTSSPYLIAFFIGGWAMIAIGLTGSIQEMTKQRTDH